MERTSKRLAYIAIEKGRSFVVVDKLEMGQYDQAVCKLGNKIVFDSSESLPYLALKSPGESYQVTVDLKCEPASGGSLL